jgi:hypothetical protein
VANGEILGVTLLMEDVLQTGFQDVSLLTDHLTNGEGGDKAKERKPRSASIKISEKRGSATLGTISKLRMYLCLCCIYFVALVQ